MRAFAVVAVAAALTACSAPLTVNAPISADDYKDCNRSGGSTVVGQAFGRTKGGDIKSAAGFTVHLDRVTPYSSAVFKALHDHGPWEDAETEANTMKDLNPVMLGCRRNAQVDLSGHFTFKTVPFGDYFASIYIRWQSRGHWTGGWQIKRIRVFAGQDINDLIL